MAEKSYNPFSGFCKPLGGATAAAAFQQYTDGPKDRKREPIDWASKTLVPVKWKSVDIGAIKHAAKAKQHSSSLGSVAKELTEEEAAAWRTENAITVFMEGSIDFKPMKDFSMLAESGVPVYLPKKLVAQGFAAPTPIQAQCWPILLGGRDLVGVAKTGSGKTLAFIVPALAHIALQTPLRPGDGPMCVVLAPTRELAQQIEQETLKVLPQNLRCGCVYGGAPKGPQLGMLRQGVHILVATPGRLIDILEIRRVNLLRVTYLVLDEADRMLDMGFEPQVRAICGQIRPDRQTLMFSATWPREIQKMAASFQRNWIRVHVGSTELIANTDVAQHFILTSEQNKFDELKKLMMKYRDQRVLVFCKTKKTADYLEYQLKRIGVDVMAIHGDKEQRQREFILERFRRDARLCLVATDVAARGLDIKDLEVVVNYDFPMQVDDYVHRIGRTGRAGAKGESFTMITQKESQLNPAAVKQLIGIIERAQQTVPSWLREWSETRGFSFSPPKRNRNMMGYFSGGSGYGHSNAPQLRMPGDVPSFDARGGGSSHGGSHFGLGSRDGTQAFGGSASLHYKRFDDSDGDDDSGASPVKRLKN